MSDHPPFNPLDKANLGKSVAEALLASAPHPLAEIDPFIGAGVYAIYYTGGFTAYSAISARKAGGRSEKPIYVGKAIPPGGRKGGVGLDRKPGTALFKRLKEHADSIEQAKNLDLSDFHCRFLVVDDIWIPLGEALLITWFAPVWNLLIDGFGNHTPGKGRFDQRRSRWDVLHPGRPWAEKCKKRPETQKQIIADLTSYLHGR